MKWIAKAALHNALSVTPSGQAILHLLQRRVTRTLPGNDDHFRLKAQKAFWHFNALERLFSGDVSGARLFEFGAGWDLIGPLILYGLGVEDQTVVDVAPLVALDLVEHSIARYAALVGELETRWDRSMRPLDDPSVLSLAELSERFGIKYLSPCDAGATDLPSGSVDFVSSTSTLQHVPQSQLAPILQECHRLLRAGGAMSCHIDMFDGFAQSDEKLSLYNFLKFNDRIWELVNSRTYFQNRLRARDFVSLFQGAGFDLAVQEIHRPGAEEAAKLRDLRLSRRFRTYPSDELAITQMSLVAIRP